MKQELLKTYRELLNRTLPQTYQQPVRYNHCFNRIILDWLFKDVWYRHLDRKKTAVSQLSEIQLKAMIDRMQAWLQNFSLLVEDNNRSISLRAGGRDARD